MAWRVRARRAFTDVLRHSVRKMLRGCANTPWFGNGLALILEAKGAAIEYSIVKAICLEELSEMWDVPSCGVGRPFKGNRTARFHDYGCKLKEAIYQDKGFLTHVLKTLTKVRP